MEKATCHGQNDDAGWQAGEDSTHLAGGADPAERAPGDRGRGLHSPGAVGASGEPAERRMGADTPAALRHAVILLVLVGIFARQLRRAGRLRVAGFLVAFVGTAMALLEG